MNIPLRRCFGLAVAVLTLLGPLSAKSHAQFAGFLNPYVNPAAAGFSTVGALGTAALAGTGLMPGGYGAMGGPHAHMGYGSLMNGPMGMGGSRLGGAYGLGGGIAGTLVGSAASGYGLGFGYSMMGTQWMMNPYQGYLQGAASITKSNAQYYQTIQQAKLSRQEAIRSSLETRRAMIEEADWEREHMPDPEKIRQQALQRELRAAQRQSAVDRGLVGPLSQCSAPPSHRPTGRRRARARCSSQRRHHEAHPRDGRGYARQPRLTQRT